MTTVASDYSKDPVILPEMPTIADHVTSANRIADPDDAIQYMTGLDIEAARQVPWVPDSDEKVAWAILKYLQLNAAKREVKRQACLMVKALDRRIATFRYLFWEPLREYAKPRIPRGKKSINFVTGRLQFKTRKASFKCKEDKASQAAALAWAKENAPHAIYSEPRVDKAILEDWYRTTGEVPPGCDADLETITFHVMPIAGKGRAPLVVEAAFDDDEEFGDTDEEEDGGVDE